ncbi:hypothetical protein Pyn_16631 [Prunus yedoensis var. nudiflora]|uniref:Uncharacterized protein n=1 Tax=Prunus yedoensis var. nudiflora TaxID=2094558 RepID=A0A314UW24_PRUYE|nr:hypothetical protein Pyn_16631 [Prunus yedoensis var. nudiflora]
MRTLEVLWRIGVGIEGGVLTKSGAMKALELCLSSKQGNEMRERTSILKVFAEEAVKSYGRTTEDLNVLVNEIICGPSKPILEWRRMEDMYVRPKVQGNPLQSLTTMCKPIKA